MACQFPPFNSKAHYVLLREKLLLNQQNNNECFSLWPTFFHNYSKCNQMIHNGVFWSKTCLPKCSFGCTFSPCTCPLAHDNVIQCSSSWAQRGCVIIYYLTLTSNFEYWLNLIHEPIIRQALFNYLINSGHYSRVFALSIIRA